MVSLIGCAVSYKRRKPIVSIDIMTNKSNVVYFVAKSIICGLTSFQMWKQINRACAEMIPLYLNFLRHIEEKVLAKILRNPPKRFLSTGPLEKGLFFSNSIVNEFLDVE